MSHPKAETSPAQSNGVSVALQRQPRRISVHKEICGGDPCITGTRVPVWVIERCRRMNRSVDEIREDYPFLEIDDLKDAWLYADQHPEEIARQIEENEAE